MIADNAIKDIDEIYGLVSQLSAQVNKLAPKTDKQLDLQVVLIRRELRAIRSKLRASINAVNSCHLGTHKISRSDRLRFWDKVDVLSDEECWEWQAGKAAHGYGAFTFKGNKIGAHRFSIWMHTNIFPGDATVCHKCHNPSCVNPNHLYIGTPQTNGFDRRMRNLKSKPSFNVLEPEE